MPPTKIRLDQIEQGRVLKQLVHWFKISHRNLSADLDSLRARSRAAAQQAGIGAKDVARLIAEVRARRAKT